MTTPEDQPASGRRRVRPYAMTGGRTRPTHDDLETETLISTTSVGEQTPKLTVEQRAIAALCRDVLSIAEVSSQLHLPLGVIRVLVGDMADEHLVSMKRPAPSASAWIIHPWRTEPTYGGAGRGQCCASRPYPPRP